MSCYIGLTTVCSSESLQHHLKVAGNGDIWQTIYLHSIETKAMCCTVIEILIKWKLKPANTVQLTRSGVSNIFSRRTTPGWCTSYSATAKSKLNKTPKNCDKTGMPRSIKVSSGLWQRHWCWWNNHRNAKSKVWMMVTEGIPLFFGAGPRPL